MSAQKNDYLWIGKSLPRRDANDKLTGRGLFTSDVQLPGMLHAAVLRSPHAHARIKSIDASGAWAMKGVRAIASHENCPKNLYNASAPMFTTTPMQERVLDQYIFDDTVRYVGDEVAAVAADTPQIAEAAVKAIKVEYEVLPHVLDAYEAMRPEAPELHPGKGVTPEGHNVTGEISRFYWGLEPEKAQAQIEAAFAECDVVVDEKFRVPIVKQVQMETMSAVALWNGNDELTVYSTSQTPHPSRFIIASIFGMPASKVRLLAPPYIGGGFGVRIGLSAKAEPIAALLAKLSGKPVRMVFTRDEDFTSTDTRHGGYVNVKLGAKKDGTFHALDLKIVLATGAYCSFGVELPAVAGGMGLAIYDMPHKRYIGHSVYTNQTPAGAFRGFGNPQSNFGIERTVDMLAQKLGMNPYELRLKNIQKAGEPWFLPYPCSSSELVACMEQGAAGIGWDKRGSFDNSGPVKRGLGMAVGTHCSNAWPFCVDYDNAYAVVQVDGSLQVSAALPDLGTGTATSQPQLAAEAYGAAYKNVQFTFADTASTPFSIGCHASRGMYAMGLAVKQACEDALSQTLDYAAKLFGKKAEELSLRNSLLAIKGQEGKVGSLKDVEAGKAGACDVAELAYHAHVRNVQFIGIGRMIPPNSPPWHCCFADVSVDTETGQVTVHKLVAAHDVGFAVNPMIVEGQIEGGLIQGLGYALTEEITYDASGRQNNNNMHTYMVPTFQDIPEVETIIVSSLDPQGPYGVKGAGECSLVCPGGAIANAVSNAIGREARQLPLTPERVLDLVNGK